MLHAPINGCELHVVVEAESDLVKNAGKMGGIWFREGDSPSKKQERAYRREWLGRGGGGQYRQVGRNLGAAGVGGTQHHEHKHERQQRLLCHPHPIRSLTTLQPCFKLSLGMHFRQSQLLCFIHPVPFCFTLPLLGMHCHKHSLPH